MSQFPHEQIARIVHPNATTPPTSPQLAAIPVEPLEVLIGRCINAPGAAPQPAPLPEAPVPLA